MDDRFLLKKITDADIESELAKIGFDSSYRFIAKDKYEYVNFKIFDLTLPQAQILKQTAISVGADCAVHRDVILASIDKTDCILGGSISQIKKIAKKLLPQPFALNQLAKQLERLLSKKIVEAPLIMGVLNLTDNSFSDGGVYNSYENACKCILEMKSDGVDILDIGAESTKPFSEPVDVETQLERILPVLKFAKENNIKTSIDTRSSIVANEVLSSGADFINDVSGFDYDENMPNIIAKHKAKVIIQHSQGTPENMQLNPAYNNLLDDVFKSLATKVKLAIKTGIDKENIIIDVGIGFGKTREQNFELIKRLDEFETLNLPMLIGLSRKSLLGMPDATNDYKDIFSLALTTVTIMKQVDIIRVHNVKLNRELVELMKNFRG